MNRPAALQLDPGSGSIEQPRGESGGAQAMMQPTATILIVSGDDKDSLPVIDALLDQGHTIKRARSAEEAIRHAGTGADLIILAGVSGDTPSPELCHRLRAQPGTAGAPVL